MNANDLLDLSLGQVEPPRREGLERELADDPLAALVLERLGRNLGRLLDDGRDEVEPPGDLARRTVAMVARHKARRAILEFAPVRVPFRWADVAVAAGIFAAGLLTLVPAVQRGKARMAMAECAFNLQQLGFGLNQYHGIHGSYPYVPVSSPASLAGMYAPMLDEAKLLPVVATLDCPANGPSALKPPLPRFSELCRGEKDRPACPPCLHHLDYAYTLGYQHKPGHPGPAPDSLEASTPLLADKPAQAEGLILEGNSPNHGGSGQNVLFNDGHVAWHPTRRLGPNDEDMFLNEFHKAAPGVDARDSVLVPGNFRFDGRRSRTPDPRSGAMPVAD